MEFERYPFEKLNEILEGITPNKDYDLCALTIGEPQFDTPDFIQNEFKNTSDLLRRYPKTSGEDYLVDSMLTFVKNRFNVDLKSNEIIPSFGTREVLFNFPQYYLFDKENPTMAFVNPFYQIYEGAAIASRAKMIHMELNEANNYQASLDDETLKECDLVIINYPNNPTSANMSLEEMTKWVKKALEFDFVLINDECYSDIYFDDATKPCSLLEASINAGNDSFKNILVVNSISKRSSAPGLRSGFIAGDAEILNGYMKYRTYIGCASPLPLQKAAAIAWANDEHVQVFRDTYKRNFEIAREILGIEIPNATFYIWLKVGDDVEFTKNLYKEKNVKVLPGRYLGRNGAGEGYIRIALVENEEKTKEALNRIKDFMND